MEPSLLLHWCCKGLLAVAIPSPTLSTKEGCDGINFVSCCGSSDILGGRLSIIINFQSKLSNTRDIFITIPCAPKNTFGQLDRGFLNFCNRRLDDGLHKYPVFEFGAIFDDMSEAHCSPYISTSGIKGIRK